MQAIQYNDSAFALRFEYPSNWDAQSISGVNVTITDVDGTSLVTATAATLYAATTLNAAAAAGDATITLAAAATAVNPGDRLEIAASTSGPTEEVTVESYNSSTKVATLERELRYGHASGTAVKGLWCTYSLNTSTTATWTLGRQVLIDWDPNTDDQSARELGEIISSAYAPSDVRERFNVLYPDEYEALENSFDKLLSEALKQLDTTMLARGLIKDRIQDQAIVTPVLCALMRRIILFRTNKADQQTVADVEYNRLLEELCKLPLWADDNQDKIEDEDEVDTHQPMIFERSM